MIAIRGRRSLIYFDPKGHWDFMPAIHRPGGSRALHDDWPIGFRSIPRTWTSFIFLDAQVIKGSTTHYFTWQGKRYPKPWALAGEYYKALLTFKDPITLKIIKGIYETGPLLWDLSTSYRIGPRISDDLENAEPTVYVNWIRGPRILTFGTKKLKEDK